VNCPDCLERLQSACDERRSVTIDADLAAHLAACAGCRELFASAEQLQRGLSLLSPPALPSEFTERVVQRIDRDRRWRPVRFVMRVAAALIVGATGTWLAFSMFKPVPARTPPEPPRELAKLEVPPPSLQARLSGAREATLDLTRQLTQDTARGVRLFVPPFERLPDAMTPLNLDAPVISVQEVSRSMADGFEPVTDSARRAWGMFRRMVPGDERKKS
jgi:hypothetical protein